jgi:hypothetical protein
MIFSSKLKLSAVDEEGDNALLHCAKNWLLGYRCIWEQLGGHLKSVPVNKKTGEQGIFIRDALVKELANRGNAVTSFD